MGISPKAMIKGEEILKYIPQRPPVVMVDEFFGIAGDGTARSGFTVSADNIFCSGVVMDECALVENMAQSAALRAGYMSLAEGKEVPLGFIGAVDKCEIVRRARTGEHLLTTVRTITEIMNVTLAEASVKVGEEEICRCRLKIFLEQQEGQQEQH